MRTLGFRIFSKSIKCIHQKNVMQKIFGIRLAFKKIWSFERGLLSFKQFAHAYRMIYLFRYF